MRTALWKNKLFSRILLAACVISVCVSGVSACKKNKSGSSDIHGDKEENSSETQSDWWIKGWYLSGKSVPLLITVPDSSVYSESTPIELYLQDGVDLSEYDDGDIIEIKIDAIMETYPCQSNVYDVRFIEHGDVSDIDSRMLEQLSEYGWIESKTSIIVD